MADYQVVVNDRTGSTKQLALDPGKALDPQLRRQLNLKDDVAIAYRPPAGGDYRSLYPSTTLSGLQIEPGGTIYLSLPEKQGIWKFILAGAAVLVLVALGFIILQGLPGPTAPAEPTAVAAQPTDAPAAEPVAAQTTDAPTAPPATSTNAPTATPAEPTATAALPPPTPVDTTPTFTITVVLPGYPAWRERAVGMRIAGELAREHLREGGRLDYLLTDRVSGNPLDYNLEVTFVTDGPTITDTRRLADGLVRPGVTDCVVGHFQSDDTIVAGDIYSANGILTFTPASTRADVITDTRRTVWRLVSTDRYQAPEAYELAEKVGREGKILIVRPDGLFAGGVDEGFRAAAPPAIEESGIITPTLVYTRSDAPMAEYLAPAVAGAKEGEAFGMLFFIGTAQELDAFLLAYGDFPEATPIVGVSSLDDINVVTGLRAKGYNVSYTGLAVPVQTPVGRQEPLMAEWFVAQYDNGRSMPPANAAETYDGVVLCAEAIRKAVGVRLGADPAYDLSQIEPLEIANAMELLLGEFEFFSQAGTEDEPGTAAGRYVFGSGARELTNSVLILHEPGPDGADITTQLSCGENPTPGCR